MSARGAKAPASTFAALAIVLALAGCETKRGPDADAGAPAGAVADDAIPTQADFEEHAGDGLTAETLEAEIEKLEAELR